MLYQRRPKRSNGDSLRGFSRPSARLVSKNAVKSDKLIAQGITDKIKLLLAVLSPREIRLVRAGFSSAP